MNNSFVDRASTCISRYVLEFIDDRPWEAAGCKLEITPSSGTVRDCWLSHGNVVDEKVSGWEEGNPKWGDSVISTAAMDAAWDLSEEVFRTTGQRIWGLTFTLYPSGKFKLDYDYTKPDWYDDSEEPLSPEAAVEDLRSAGVDVAVQTSSRDEQQAAFFHDAMTWLQERTAANARDWGLGLEAQWNLDMNTGQLCFSFSDGRTVLLPVQVVGTYNTQDGTLLWGWDHPSVPGPLRLAAERLRDYFKEHGWMRLNDRILRCTEDEAWQLTAAAARLSAAAGAYRGNAGGTWVYMTFGSSR